MTTLPKLPTSTLTDIHALIGSKMLRVTILEKWAIGHAALALHDTRSLDLNELEHAVEHSDKKAINDILEKGNVKRHEALKLKTNHSKDNFILNTEYYGDPLNTLHENGECDFLATISANSYGYNIQPLEYLLDGDALIVARVISLIRQLFIYSPLPEDMEAFGSWRLEVIETLEEWFPDSIRQESNDTIKAYWEKHKQSFIDDSNGELDDEDEQESLISDYLERNEPRPSWYPLLSQAIKGSPKQAVSTLKQEVKSVENRHAKAFAECALDSISDYLKHFKSMKDLENFNSVHRDLDYEARTRSSEDPEIDMAFMMAWGTDDNYWWRLLVDVNQMMMEVGEAPCYRVSVKDKESRELFELSSERLYRGASLFDDLSKLIDTLVQERE